MMPSRGLAPLCASARVFVRPGRVPMRSISTASPRPSIRPHLPSRRSPIQSAVARRHISWWPLGSSTDSQAAAPPSPSQPPSPPTAAASSASPSTATPPVQASPTPVAAAQEPATAATATATDFSSVDLETIQQAAVPITAMPEQIGYLKAIGLDYGWGPTSMLEWSLEHIHIYTGLPWWSSIVITALGVRLLLFPMYLRSTDVAARQQAMQPVLKPLQARMMEAFHAKDSQMVQQIRAQMKQVNQQAGISLSQIFTPIVIQGVIAYCALKLLRAMSNLPVPGMLDGGLLWFTDLTVRDPYFALPVIMAGSMHLLIRLGGEGGAMQTQPPGMRAFMLYVMPLIIVLSMSFFPAAVNLWLAATGSLAIVQAKTFQNKNLRAKLGLTPLYKAPAPATTKQETPKVSPSVVSSKTIDVSATSSRKSSFNYQAPNIKYSVRDAGPLNTVDTETGSPTRWAADQVNKVGEGWQDMKNSMTTNVKSYLERKQKGKSKTKSKEFLARAKAYEDRAQARGRR